MTKNRLKTRKTSIPNRNKGFNSINEEISCLKRAINQLERERNLSKLQKSVLKKFKTRLRKTINLKKRYGLSEKKIIQQLKSGEMGFYKRIDRGGLKADDRKLSGR